MTPAIKTGSDENHFNVSLTVRDKVTRQCPQTTTFLKREENRSGIEPRPVCLPAARPNRLTCLAKLSNAFITNRADRLACAVRGRVSREQVRDSQILSEVLNLETFTHLATTGVGFPISHPLPLLPPPQLPPATPSLPPGTPYSYSLLPTFFSFLFWTLVICRKVIPCVDCDEWRGHSVSLAALSVSDTINNS